MRRLTKHLTPALAAVAVLGTAGVAAAAPNLVPVIDTNPDSALTNPPNLNNWYVETTAAPYSVHFFYGATIRNTGADDFVIQAKLGSTSGDTAVAQQVIGGTPADITGSEVVVRSNGVPNPGHTDWGVSNVFSMALTPQGAAPIQSVRDAFCWNSGAPFVAQCSTASADADGFVSGIAAGDVDAINPGTPGAYFDVTGAAPGPATVVEAVNPTGKIDEGGATGDNATPPLSLDIPGVTAQAATASATAGTAVAVPLSGKATIVAPGVLGTRAGGTPAKADGTLTYTATNGAHGAVTVSGSTATYTPAAGFTGADSFTFTATDSRGLQSAPATVTVNVAAAPGGGGGPTPPVVKKVTLKLKPGYVVMRKGGKTYLRIKGKLPRSQAGRTVIVQRKVGKKVRTLTTVKVAKNGIFTKLVRVSGATITVRTRIGASATAKAATSPFKTVVIVRSKKR